MSIIGGVNMGSLTDYLFFFANGMVDANWQSASKGYLGDVAINGVTASERTSGSFAYAGVISTNDATLSAWQNIVNNNPTQALSALNQTALIAGLQADLVSAIKQINALPATPGYTSVTSTDLDGLNTQNGINEIFVINITDGLNFSQKINITGDAGDVFILRWDTDGNPQNGYQGQLKPQSGGAIVPHGGLKPTNFISVAGNIGSSGGGLNPAVPYPQGPRYNDGTGPLITNGEDWNGGGFFTGYLLTTGAPGNTPDPITGLYIGQTSSLSNGIFVGGWYSLTTKFSMTSGTSGVYVSPNPSTYSIPRIDVKKYVSPDNGISWLDAEIPPGPVIPPTIDPQFKFVVQNAGNVPLSLVSLSDSVYGVISVGGNLAVNDSFEVVITKPWSQGDHENEATAVGTYGTDTVSSTDFAHYLGIVIGQPAVRIVKYVSPDNGATWLDANTPPGPDILSNVAPQFKFVVTNIGTDDLTNVVITDDLFGVVGGPISLVVGASTAFYYTDLWQQGQHVNTARATGNSVDGPVFDQNSAYYNGVLAAPDITIKKYVSPDNGVTWLDANTSPGPTIPSSIQPRFKFVVTNTGNTELTDVLVTDSVYSFIDALLTLDAGESVEWEIIKPWNAGAHENIATVTANFDGTTLSASDNAWYFGEEAPVPAISIAKYVSVDDGATWLHVNMPIGPLLPDGMTAMFKYVVTNTGNTKLTNVTVTDSVIGAIATGVSLGVGESQTWII